MQINLLIMGHTRKGQSKTGKNKKHRGKDFCKKDFSRRGEVATKIVQIDVKQFADNGAYFDEGTIQFRLGDRIRT